MRHDATRDTFAELMDKVCYDVEIDPHLQSFRGQSFDHRTTITEDGTRLDMKANGLWETRFSKTYFDVKIFGWLSIGRSFLVERTEVEPFDRIAGIERNAVEFYRVCFMAWSLRSLRQVAFLRHGHMARLFASLRSCIQGTRGM